MQNLSLHSHSWFFRFSIAILFTCLAVFAVKGWYAVLSIPIFIWYLWLVTVDWKAAYFLLLFSIPLSTQLGLLDGKLSTTIPDEPITWLFLLLLPIVIAEKPWLLPWRTLLSPITVIIALQLLWLLVSVIYSQDLTLSIKFMLSRIWMIAAFFIFPLIVFRNKQDFKRAFLVLLVPIVASILIIIVRHAILHFQFLQINEAIGALYYNHVEYSTIISMFFPLVCIAWMLTKDKSRRIRWLLTGLVLLFAAAILLSYARAAILAVVFSALVATAIRFRLVSYIMPVFYGTIILVMAYMVHNNKYLDYRPNYEQTYMHSDINTHLSATFSGTDMSAMERVYRWIAAVRMSSEKPLTGFGPNTFVHNYKSYTVPAFKTYVSRNTEQSTTHNYFLYILAEQGWPAMLCYAALIMVVLQVAQSTYHRFKDKFYKYCTLGLVMLFAAAFINNCFSELTDTHKVGALFYLSMALLMILSRKSKLVLLKESAAT
jgi:O-antigen ligase